MGFADKTIAKLGIKQSMKFMISVKKRIMPVYKMVDTCAAEFESATPYYYGTYEDENESIVTDRKSVVVLRFRSNPYWSRG